MYSLSTARSPGVSAGISPMAPQSRAACVSSPACASAITRSSAGMALPRNAAASGLSAAVDFSLLDLTMARHPATPATHAIRMTGTTRPRHEKPLFSGPAPAGGASGAGTSGLPVGAPQNGHVAR